MAIKRRQNKLQDLAASGIVTNRISGSIPFEYSGPNSPLFTVSEIPDPAPQGKSSFLIAGTELLKNSVEVKIEIIDSEGGVIYTEPVANYLEGNARRVSIEVYDDTPPGPANLFILAMVDPDEWEDETGTNVRNFPSPQPLKARGKRKKRRKKRRDARRQMTGMPELDDIRRRGAGAFFINPNFTPPPSNDSRFRRRRGRRRRGRTSDISDQYNFLQKIEMQIVPTATNTEKILFYEEPRITVTEAFKPFVANVAPSSSFVLSGSLEGQVINDTQAPGAASALDSFGARLKAFRRRRKFKKFAGKGGLSKRKRITRRASPEVDNYSFSSNTFNFTSAHVGATVNLNNPSVDTTQFPTSRFTIPATGSFEVIKVKNSSTVIPDKPFRIRDNQLQQVVDAPITHASFSITFVPEVTQSISITNFRSYADVRVANIRTFSGDVFRTKIYRKSEESIGDYEVFADLPLESSELLLNTSEGTGLERTGYFTDQKDINKFWEVSQSSAGVSGAASASVLSYDIDTQMDAVYISGSTLGVNEFLQFKLRGPYTFQLEQDVAYDFSAEIYGRTTDKVLEQETGGTQTKKYAQLEVYISGSNIPAQEGNEAFGAKLGVLRIDDGSLEKDFKVTTGDFESTATSTGCNLIFKVIAGKWYISDLSVRPATETGFSPDLFTFQAPMPENEVRPEKYEFLAEFYDVNNNQADSFAFTVDPTEFVGSNMVITGTDNVLESNLFIGGESTASGMHLGGVSSVLPETGTSGAAGSGFMRSVGYTGFTSASNPALPGKPGFMIYSGSVLPDSGDEYDGVGLELIGESGSLRFSTKPSRFEVQADAFFVGNQDLQFISGAAGNIEISSSNFHLSRQGDVTMQGTITADAGNIGGFTITSTAIASPDKSLIMSGSGQITGSTVLFTGGKIGGFDLSANEIKHSGDLLRLKASGQITGSNVKFDGGTIGGLTLGSSSLSAGNLYEISSSQNLADPVSFISSSNFKVSAAGKITGSNVLFTGGTIAGWTIGDTTLTGGNLILSKDGSMRSSNYVSDFSGWSISAEQNGFAEFENVKIRGTLSTTTFEKESVNAVGGQLFVANSTALTGSTVAASDVTMSVENASGFAHGEILVAKKVTNTGFTTEYIRVNSQSLDGDLSKDELHGRIYVTRSIGTSPPAGTDSGSVGDSPGAAQEYEPGQVLASTGRIGTGYIRLNANPNNQATPFIDIVERTGDGPYDVELKARIGDLSGTAGTRNVPSGFTGFGLMSEVAFLSGSNIKLEAPAFVLGDLNQQFVSGSNSKMEISSSAFHLQPDGQLLVGDKANGKFIEWDNTNLTVRGDLSVDNLRTPSSIGGSPPTHANASASISASGQVAFRGEYFLGNADTTFISGSNSNLQISSSKFHLKENGDVEVTGEINATSGVFSGNLTSTAIITGGTIRTADETVGSGKSVKINGTSNTLEFFGDAAAFNSLATDIPTKLFFLDDSNQLIEGNAYSDFPGIGFPGFDAQSSTYDNATDNGTAFAMAKGGFYVPYNYGKGYTQFETMLTGHALGLYRGARGETKLSGDSSERAFAPTSGNDFDYFYDTPEVYEVAQLKLIQSNGSPSARHSQDGNPTGSGGQSTHGDGGNHHIFTIQATNVLSRSNIADNDRATDGSGFKVARSVSAGNNFRHGSINGGGYNYFDHMELVGGDFHNSANDQVEQGFLESYWYQFKPASNTISRDNAGTTTLAFDQSFGQSNIDTANGGSGHPTLTSANGATPTVDPENYSPSNWSKCNYMGYRIKVDSVNADEPTSTQVEIKLRLKWGNHTLKDTTIVASTLVVMGGITGTYTGAVDLRSHANTWKPLKDDQLTVQLRFRTTGGGGSIQIDNGGGSNDSYVYAYGEGNYNTRTDNIQLLGTRIGQFASGSDNTIYGVKNDSSYGHDNYGFYTRIRGAGQTYGVYSRVNETGIRHNIKDAQNGQTDGSTVYAGYFLGNLHVAGNITYTGTITDTSDIRLKENIRIASGSLNLIKQLETKRFDWKTDYEYEIGPHREGVKNEIGFIAQDVEKIDGLSDLIEEDTLPKRGFDPDLLNTHHPDYKGKKSSDFHKMFKFMNYEKLIPHLVNAMQEQQEQIEELKKEIEELKQ